VEPSSIPAERLSLSLQRRDGALVITVLGDLDLTTRDLLDEYLTRATGGYDHIILECAAVGFMDCASLAVIAAHWKAVSARGGSLTLTSVRCLPARVLQLTGLAAVLSVCDSTDHALKAMAAAGGAPKHSLSAK
jgi:anti-anti-sigma factor